MTTNNYLTYIPKRVQLNPTLRCISGFFLKTNISINNFPKWAMHKYYNEKYANQRNVSKNSLGKIRIEQSTLISGCLNCLIKMKSGEHIPLTVNLQTPIKNVKHPQYLEVYEDNMGLPIAEIQDRNFLYKMKDVHWFNSRLYEIKEFRNDKLELISVEKTSRDEVVNGLGRVLSFTEGVANGVAIAKEVLLFFATVNLSNFLYQSAEKDNIGWSEKMLRQVGGTLTPVLYLFGTCLRYSKQIYPLLKQGCVQPLIGFFIGFNLAKALHGREESEMASYALGTLGAMLLTGVYYNQSFKGRCIKNYIGNDYRENVMEQVQVFLDTQEWFRNNTLNCTSQALLFSISKGHKRDLQPAVLAEIVKRLIKNGANLNVVDRHGYAPLHYAIRKYNDETVKILINTGADTELLCDDGNKAIHLAVFDRNIEMIKVLIENGADLNGLNRQERTPLQYAAHNKHTEIVELISEEIKIKLLKEIEKKDANLKKIHNWITYNHGYLNSDILEKIFLFSAEKGDADIITVLCKHNEEFNDINNREKEIALYIAAKYRHIDVVKVLCEFGVDIHAKVSEGHNGFSIAQYFQYTDITKFLQDIEYYEKIKLTEIPEESYILENLKLTEVILKRRESLLTQKIYNYYQKNKDKKCFSDKNWKKIKLDDEELTLLRNNYKKILTPILVSLKDSRSVYLEQGQPLSDKRFLLDSGLSLTATLGHFEVSEFTRLSKVKKGLNQSFNSILNLRNILLSKAVEGEV